VAEDDDGYGNPLLYESLSSSSPATAPLRPTFLPASWTQSNYEPSTPLWEHILNYISATGRPISFATYMRWCLTHPEHGYYTTNRHALDEDDLDDGLHSGSIDRYMIGRDFVTAPEISSLFGECLAVWFASEWQRAQDRLQQRRRLREDGDVTTSVSPEEEAIYQWVECGPGKGTLMQDLLRASLPLNMLRSCTHIHLVEASPVLRRTQRRSLEELTKALRVRFRFADSRSSLSTSSTPVDGGDDKDRSTWLSDASVHHTITVLWHDTLSAVVQWQQHQQHQRRVLQESTANSVMPSNVVTFCVCQEFVDALPVYSFQKTGDGWRERLIDLAMEDDGDDDDRDVEEQAQPAARPSETPIARDSASRRAKKPRLRVVLAPEPTPSVRTLLNTDDRGFMPGEDPGADLGSIVEVSPEGILLARDIAKLIGDSDSGGGAALIIDYGGEGSCDSIRAFSRHDQVSVLSRPGLVDITADVDFAALKHAINQPPRSENKNNPVSDYLGARAYGPVTQGAFLLSMGLKERVLTVIEDDRTDEDHAEDLYQSLVRLASPDEMGERFKVLAIVNRDGRSDPQPSPAGFQH
jgi:NADH dehydrogenase [ubiquinone] 1 alpha subcomplex assembly factor 7